MGEVSKGSIQGCSAVQCSVVQCSAVQWSAVQWSAVQCSAVQCSAVQCTTTRASSRPLPITPSKAAHRPSIQPSKNAQMNERKLWAGTFYVIQERCSVEIVAWLTVYALGYESMQLVLGFVKDKYFVCCKMSKDKLSLEQAGELRPNIWGAAWSGWSSKYLAVCKNIWNYLGVSDHLTTCRYCSHLLTGSHICYERHYEIPPTSTTGNSLFQSFVVYYIF